MTAPPTYPAERTALAWRRTALAAMGTAALFVNHAAAGGWHRAAVAPAVGAVVLLFIAWVCVRRNRSLQHGDWSHGSRVVAVTTAAVLAVTATALVIGWTEPVAHPIFSTLDTSRYAPEVPAATGAAEGVAAVENAEPGRVPPQRPQACGQSSPVCRARSSAPVRVLAPNLP